MVDVVDEGVEGVDALLQAALDAVPFIGGDDARDQVEWKDTLGAGGVAVHVEGDAQLEQQTVGGVLIAQKLAVRQRLDDIENQLDVRAAPAIVCEHLIVETFGLVRRELHPGACEYKPPVFMLAHPKANRKRKN